MEIGEYSYGAFDILWAHHNKKCIVGKFTSIGSNCVVYLGGNHNTRWITTYPFGTTGHRNVFTTVNVDHIGHPFTNGDIVIGNDVWIGDRVSIMSGVTIGDGCIIAAFSHVVKDVEPYSIVGGNPAKFIRYRFSEEQRQDLLRIKWWEWDAEKINHALPLLCSENIDTFIGQYRELNR